MINAKSTEIRLKYLFEKRMGGAWGDEPEIGNSIVCIRAADLITDNLQHKQNDLTRRSFKEEEFKKKQLQEGDIIIEKSGGGDNQPVGRIALFSLDEPALCSNFMEVLRPNKKKLNPTYGAYIFYALWNSRINTKAIKQTTGIQNLDLQEYLDNKVNLPSIDEQIKIVHLLEQRVDYIDRLIEAKERFLNVLSEKRQALISNAVTKGLNTKVKMKDSGVDWLGKIPEHWELKKIKYISKLKSGEFITSDSISENEKYAVYGGNGVRGYTSDKTHNGEFILIGRQGALCGNINYARGEFWASEHAVVCHPIKQYEIIWFGELLRIMNLNQYSAAAAQPGLSVEVISNLSIPFPPFHEQKLISDYVIEHLKQIDDILSFSEKSINLLKERKSVLISEAVTGQLKINS